MISKSHFIAQSKIPKGVIYLGIIITLIAILGFMFFPQWLISWDEEAVLKVVQVNSDIIAGRKDYSTHVEFYGTLFNFIETAVHKVKEITFPPSNSEISELVYRIADKHRFVFFLSLITYGAVAGLVSILAGWEYAWIGAMVLFFMPRFWGHSFFNSKDIPLAMMFTLGTLLGVCLIRYYSRQQPPLSLGKNRATLYSILYGLFVGCAAGTRIDASVLALFVPLTDIILRLQRRERFSQIWRFGQFYLAMLITSVFAIFAIYPASWANPIRWYLEAFNFYYKEDWPHTVLFNGESILANNLPWHYLPTWLLISTPVITMILFVVGSILAIGKYRGFSIEQQACLLLILLQIFALPIFAILYRATLFDGLRQSLYILPAIAVLAASAIAWLYQMLHPKFAKLALVGLLVGLTIPIGIDLIQLYPYDYVYFNRAFGGLPAAIERFETDYWGLSMPEAVMWLNRNRKSTVTLVSTEPAIAAKHLADEDLNPISYDEFKPDGQPFYYLSVPRWGWERRFAECQSIHSVTRQNAPLSIIKKCP